MNKTTEGVKRISAHKLKASRLPLSTVSLALKKHFSFFKKKSPEEDRAHAQFVETTSRKGAPKSAWRMPLRLSAKEQMLFAKRLSFLIRSGVPILDSLHILREQTRSRGGQKMYGRIAEDIANGKFLHVSLMRFRGVFGTFAINIIKVGELSGILSKNLLHLADELQKRYELKRKVLGAMVYPIIITLGTLGLVVLLTAYIFPKIMPIFQSLSVELPFTTRALIAISSFIREWGFVTLGVLVLVSIALVIINRTVTPFRFAVHRTLISVPLAGGIVRTYNMANLCRTVGLLLRSGITLTEAVTITSDATANLVYRRELGALAERVRAGESLSKYLTERKRFFPPMLTHMVAIGEKTGSLSDTFIYLAELYEGELDGVTKNLSSALEPALMIVMGVIVGFVAVSVITPIYEITQNLSR